MPIPGEQYRQHSTAANVMFETLASIQNALKNCFSLLITKTSRESRSLQLIKLIYNLEVMVHEQKTRDDLCFSESLELDELLMGQLVAEQSAKPVSKVAFAASVFRIRPP